MLKFQQKSNFQSISQFHIFPDSKLGTGSFGSVILAIHISTCKLYALKIINLQKISNDTKLKLIQKQNKIHGKLDHPHIVKLWDNFVQDDNMYMVMDYVQRGSLFYYQNKRITFPETESFKYFYQTLKAVKYLHFNDIMHRDIKPQNLLIDSGYNIKLCDFGWSTNNITQKRTTFCGTYEYMAPQMIFQSVYDYKIDIWALGILLYELLHGFAPFKGESVNQVKHKMKIGQYTLNSEISNQCKELIIMILKFQPDERISLQQIQSSKWVKKMQKILSKYYIDQQQQQINIKNQQNINKNTITKNSQNQSNVGNNKNDNNIRIQNISCLEQSPQQHTQSTSIHNFGTLDHTQSLMVLIANNHESNTAEKIVNKEEYVNNFGKTNKVNLHKKTISVTTFFEPDGDIPQSFQQWQSNFGNEKPKEKEQDKNNNSEIKEKSKQSKIKKEKQQSFKNFTSTVKNLKKKFKNCSQLSNMTNDIAHISSDNELKFNLQSDISQKSSFNKQQKAQEQQICTKRAKIKNFATLNIHGQCGNNIGNKRCKTMASNDIFNFNKKQEWDRLQLKQKKQKVDKSQKDKINNKIHGNGLVITSIGKKLSNIQKKRSQQHIGNTISLTKNTTEIKLQTKSKQNSKSKSKNKHGYRHRHRHGRGNKQKNIASQPSLVIADVMMNLGTISGNKK